MFSKKAASAIQAGKKQWEGFLHSLGIAPDASVTEIAHAEAEHTHHEKPAIAPVGEVISVGHHHTEAANDSQSAHAHGNVEHPDQERHAA